MTKDSITIFQGSVPVSFDWFADANLAIAAAARLFF
jgi:hypothetical protein